MILLSGNSYITFCRLLYYFLLKVILLFPEYYITFLRPTSGLAPPQPSLSSHRASSDEGKPLSAARRRGTASTEARPDEANQHQHLSCLAVLGIAPVGLYPYCLHLTQGLVALTGLRTLGFEKVAPLGLAPPLIPYQERG